MIFPRFAPFSANRRPRSGVSMPSRSPANAYLHHMVRNIVGTLLDVQRESNPRAAMTKVLMSADRRYAGATAPAAGLYLWRVEYPPSFGIPAPEPQIGLN